MKQIIYKARIMTFSVRLIPAIKRAGDLGRNIINAGDSEGVALFNFGWYQIELIKFLNPTTEMLFGTEFSFQKVG